MMNVFIIALMSFLSPLASSTFTPGIGQIADSLHTTEPAVIGATTGYVVTLGIGPMILAPLSETFGRRTLYIACFVIFTICQVPQALAPNVQVLIVARTFAGFFGSVGIANGGGTLNDMFDASERAGVFGWYLLGPLFGPTIGPLLGGVVVEFLGWRWVFWILTIVCAVNTLLGFLFLRESYAPILLAKKCREAADLYGHDKAYTFPGEDTRSLGRKVLTAIQRPTKILLTQPIVQVMALYQAVIFSTMYTLYTNMQSIYQGAPYNFSTTQVGSLYVVPGIGFLLAVWFLVPRIDNTYNALARRHGGGGVGKPEYRLPLANIGALLLPLSMFWFAWAIHAHAHWAVAIAPTLLWGFGQVAIFNTVQNYYIDAFSQYAASAIAAGAAVRSLFGGVVPAFTPSLFATLGYGWGWSVFGFLCVLLAPAPVLFMRFGERIRERFAVDFD